MLGRTQIKGTGRSHWAGILTAHWMDPASWLCICGVSETADKSGTFQQNMELQSCGSGEAESGQCWESRKYLVFMTSIVVEGSPNESTPDQLGVAMFYL